MIDEVKEDVNKGWGRVKALWKTLADEAKWKIIAGVEFGIIIGLLL